MSTELYEKIANAARKVQADTKAADVDMALSDGTVIRREGDSAKTLVELDGIIAFAEAQAATCQAGTVGVHPIGPSSDCVSPSCDQ